MHSNGADDTIFDDKVPCFVGKTSKNAPTDKELIPGWWDENDSRSKSRAMMREVLAVKGSDVMPLAVGQYLQKQVEDQFGKQAAGTSVQPGLQYDYDRYEFLVQRSAFS